MGRPERRRGRLTRPWSGEARDDGGSLPFVTPIVPDTREQCGKPPSAAASGEPKKKIARLPRAKPVEPLVDVECRSHPAILIDDITLQEDWQDLGRRDSRHSLDDCPCLRAEHDATHLSYNQC